MSCTAAIDGEQLRHRGQIEDGVPSHRNPLVRRDIRGRVIEVAQRVADRVMGNDDAVVRGQRHRTGIHRIRRRRPQESSDVVFDLVDVPGNETRPAGPCGNASVRSGSANLMSALVTVGGPATACGPADWATTVRATAATALVKARSKRLNLKPAPGSTISTPKVNDDPAVAPYAPTRLALGKDPRETPARGISSPAR